MAEIQDDAVGSIVLTEIAKSDDDEQVALAETAEDSAGEQIAPAEDGSIGGAAPAGMAPEGVVEDEVAQ